MPRSPFIRALILWAPFVVALTGIFGFTYLAVQQNYRQSLNDPQIQMAEDAASTLAQAYVPATVVPRGVPPIDMRESLSPWTVVYDASGTPLESSAVLDGAPPQLPADLFNPQSWTSLKTFAAPSGIETRVTWQPRSDVRQAVVLVRFTIPAGAPNGGQIAWVAVGRSMQEVEDRIATLTGLAAVAWGTTILASFGIILLLVTFGWL
jgi:hypothetical protein